jgi:hypothetical protein
LHGLILATPCCRDPPHKTPVKLISKALGGGNLRKGSETLTLSNQLKECAKNGTIQMGFVVCTQMRYSLQAVQRAQYQCKGTRAWSPISIDVARSRNCDHCALETRGLGQLPVTLDNDPGPYIPEPSHTPPGSWFLPSSLPSRSTTSPPVCSI